MDLDEGVTVSVGADGNLLSAAAFSGGGDETENAASAVSDAVPAVSEEDAEEKARAWLTAEINPEELGSIELVGIHQQMPGRRALLGRPHGRPHRRRDAGGALSPLCQHGDRRSDLGIMEPSMGPSRLWRGGFFA